MINNNNFLLKNMFTTRLTISITTVATILTIYAGQIQAGECPLSSSTATVDTYVCSGLADLSGDSAVVLSAAPGKNLVVTSLADFGIFTSDGGLLSSSDGIRLKSTGAAGDISFDGGQNGGNIFSAISGWQNGISVLNSGTNSDISIKTSGRKVRGAKANGIYTHNDGLNGSPDDVEIEAKWVTGRTNGIYIYNPSQGSGDSVDIITTAGGLTEGKTEDGIFIDVSAGYLVLDIQGEVKGGKEGIDINGAGTGIVSVTTGAGSKVSGSSESGISIQKTGLGSTTVGVGGEVSGTDGLDINHTGSGELLIVADPGSLITATIDTGIDAFSGSGTSTSMVKVSGHIAAKRFGILSSHEGLGASVIRVEEGGSVEGTNVTGIFAESDKALSIIVNGNVFGGNKGIDAANRGEYPLSITTASDTVVEGGERHGIDVYSDYGDVTIISNGEIKTDVSGDGDGIHVRNRETKGNTSITTGDKITAGSIGVMIRDSGNSSTGAVTVTLGADILAGYLGVYIQSQTSGDILITGAGNIVSASYAGVYVEAHEKVKVDVAGDIEGWNGLFLESIDGPIELVGQGNVKGIDGAGILAYITSPNSVENIIIARDGDITATDGDVAISAINHGKGDNLITASKLVDSDSGRGISTATLIDGESIINLEAGADVRDGILNFIGNSFITVKANADLSGIILLGNGSDILTFTGGDFSGIILFDGGDDLDAADGWVDKLVFNGSDGLITGDMAISNWESIEIHPTSIISFTDGNTTLTTPEFLTGGTIDMQDNAADDVLTISGAHRTMAGGDSLITMDVKLDDGAIDISDLLQVGGDTSGTTSIHINNLDGEGGETGDGPTDGILLVSVSGSNANGIYMLEDGRIQAGDYVYSLTQQNQDWYLQSTLGCPLLGDVVAPFGEVNIQDVIAIINYVLADTSVLCSDVNDDESTTIQDVIAAINIVLGN